MKKIVMTFLCILLTAVAFAQSANMLAMARAELEKRGLEESAVRARLLENGIDVDAISPSEYPAYQDRVLRILNQMQSEKASAKTAGGTGATDGTPEAPVVAPTVSLADLPQTSMGEASAEAKLQETLRENNVSPTAGNDIYGHSLFTGKSLDVFRTTDGAQAPDTYVLGTGDEVHISIFGSSQTEIHQVISPDGSIQPTGATKIFLKGLTLAQARDIIKKKLSQHYSFRQDQIAVTITTARTIMVSIYGEVGVQGGFTVSALNTAFNALAAAGGPTAIGSLRNIQRSRGGKTTKMDLYKFMVGTVSGDKFDLQNNDILFVPVADKVVSIEGAVNRPMRYEMIEGETLADLIKYAGGLKDNAYPEFVQIERYVGGEKVYLEYDLKNIVSGAQKAMLEGGDIVRIKSINKPMENYVAISGDVYYGGNFDLEKNRSLKTLLANAKPRYTARTEYVLVERTRPDETVEVLTVPFPGVDGNPDFTLQARDAVKVLTLADFRDVATISVSGLVRTPFTRNFGLNDRMSINQAIELADGLRPNVYPIAYIFRKDLTNTAKMEYIPVSLEDDGDIMLQPGDELRV
ncbi:MAG: SLBB domain-containing protein, partial [Bacteroidales bacterium]|nr:SLBB domain-containing protein [Bacteroidales bacterium]